jgi:hypothetical protein
LIIKWVVFWRSHRAQNRKSLLVFVTDDSTFYYNNGTSLAPNWIKLLAGSGNSGGWSLTGNYRGEKSYSELPDKPLCHMSFLNMAKLMGKYGGNFFR